MTPLQRTAQLFGWIFVVVAIWGALLTGTSMDADLATADRLLGLFPVNFLHNLVHLGLGIWGIIAARSHSGARAYTVLAGGLYLVLAIAGVFFPEGFGLVPLGSHDIWLHAGLGIALLLAGIALASSGVARVEPAPIRTVRPPPRPSDDRVHEDRPRDDRPRDDRPADDAGSDRPL